MNAVVYKDLSDASAILEIEAGKTLHENFVGMNLEDKIILVNGLKKYSDYIVKEGDLVVIRSIPRGLVVVGILVVVAIAGAIYTGVQLYKLRKQAEELEALQKSLSDGVVNLPYIKGAANSLATGKSQPYIIGTHLFTPYLLAKGYSAIAGTDGVDQYYHVVLEGGFNNQVLRELNCDDVSLKDWGTTETTPQEGVYAFDETSVFYDANSLIEVSQDGNAFATAAFNSKVVSQEPGSQLKKAGETDYENLVYTLEEKTMTARVCIMFNGLRQFSDSGTKQNRTVEVIPEYSLNSGSTWAGFTFDQNGTPSNTFTRNTNQQIRFEATASFTYAQVKDLTDPVLVRLRCTTTKHDGSAYDDVYVQWVQSDIYDPDASAVANAFVAEKLIGDTERALSTLIGLKIKATPSNEEKLDRINAITSGVARVWDDTEEEWSTTKEPTSNPAAWILEVLTSPTHKPSQMDDSEIDLDSLGELYEYCDTNELTVNAVITDGDTKQILLNRLAEICNSVLYRDIYGQLAAATDTVKSNAIAILNTQNLVSFENTKTMSRQTDGIRISYVNAAGGYVQDSYLVMRDGVTRTSDSIIRDISVSGITNYNQIVKYARRVLAIETLRPKTLTAKVGKEGLYFTPLAKILVQHPSLKIGLGSAEINAVIDNGTHITGATLYEPIEYDSANANGFGVVIQCVSSTYSTPLAVEYTATDDGRVCEIEFETPIALDAAAIPHPGDVLSFGYLDDGEFNTITSPMTLIGAEVDSEGYTLSLADYNEAIYTTGTIPTYTPNITSKSQPVAVPSTVPPASIDDVEEVKNTIPSLVPSYLGRYYGEHPTTYMNGSWWLVYNDEGATGGDNEERGIYYVVNDVITLLDPTDSDVTLAKYRITTLEDVLYASNNGYTLIGAVNDPVTVYGVQTIAYMAVNAAFVSYLGTNTIRLTDTGALVGGSRYNDSGTVIDATAAGIFLSATGDVKFECEQGGFVINAAAGTVTYTGVNIDLTDSALVSYEEGSATPKTFSHENLSLVVRDPDGTTELARLQYEDDTELFGGRSLGGEVDFVATWLKDATFSASSSLSALAVTRCALAMNRGATALSLAHANVTTLGSEIALTELYLKSSSIYYNGKIYMPLGILDSSYGNGMEVYTIATGESEVVALTGEYGKSRAVLGGNTIYIASGGQTFIEAYNISTGTAFQITLGGTYVRFFGISFNQKIYFPTFSDVMQIYDPSTGLTTSTALSGAYGRYTGVVSGTKIYIPLVDQNIIEIYDIITGTTDNEALSGSYTRSCCALYGNKIYIPVNAQNILEIYDIATGTTTTKTLSGSRQRSACTIHGSKLYIPLSDTTNMEIYDIVADSTTTLALSENAGRICLAHVGSKLYIPILQSDVMEQVQLPYNVESSYASSAWGTFAEVAIYGFENISVTKMADNRHLIVGEKNGGIWYCVRATDGTYGECVDNDAEGRNPSVALLPNNSIVLAFINSAGNVGYGIWNGGGFDGTATEIFNVPCTVPKFNVTEGNATLSFIRTSTGFVNTIDCTAGTFGAPTSTGKTAERAIIQKLPDDTYRMIYRLTTGYVYTSVSTDLTTWTDTALETTGGTDISVGILGTGATHLNYAKAALLTRVDASEYAGTNETKLMRAGMGIVEVGVDTSGDYYKLADCAILRPCGAWTQYPAATYVFPAGNVAYGAGVMPIGAVTTNPSKGATVTQDKAYYRLIADDMKLAVNYKHTAAGTTGSGVYLYAVPFGYKINTDIHPVGSVVGEIIVSDETDEKSDDSQYGPLTVYSSTMMSAKLLAVANSSDNTFDVQASNVRPLNTTVRVIRYKADFAYVEA